MRQSILLAAMCIAMPSLAHADPGVTAGVTGGTLGVGPEVSYRFSDKVALRGNATFLGVNENVDSDGVNYDGNLKLGSGGAMVDFHPFGSAFRLSAGARINDNKVTLDAMPTADVEIGDEIYTAAEVGSLSGEIEANSFAPTLTLGVGGGKDRGFKFGLDAGIMLQGSPEVTRLDATGLLASDPDFQAELAAERAEIEADIENFKLYPILQIGLGYRF